MAEALGAWPFSGLWFPAAEEEREFSEGYVRSQFGMVDGLYRRFGWVIGLAFAWARVAEDLKAGGMSWNGGLTVVVVLTSAALDALWFACRVDRNPRARTGFMVAKRALVGVAPAALAPMLWQDPVVSQRSFFRFMFIASGVFPLALPTFSCPLLARHHLLIQVPTAVFMAFHAPAHACAAPAITYQSEPYIFAAWRWLSALCTGMTKSMPTPGVNDCCVDLVIAVNVVFGLAVPSYVLWASECRARLRFKNDALHELTWRTAAVHAMLLVTLLSCLWTFLHPPARLD